MRFRKGTKVTIRYTAPTGRKAWVHRWWHQVDTLIEKYRALGCTDFEVRGRGWKDWKPYR